MAAKYTDTITTNAGTALPGATVQLLDGSGALVTTYTDDALTQNAATSRTADDNGLVELYVADGTYTVRSTYDGVTRDLANVELYDLSTLRSDASASTADKARADAVGITASATDMGTYTGTTIPDNETAKQNVQSLETAVETKANASAVGVTSSAANMGTYTGTTIPDNETAKQNIQSLETAVETKANASAVGVTSSAANMGTYTGSTITDNQTAKQNIQELETAVEARGYTIETYADIATTTIPAIVDSFYLQGYSAVGDGGGAWYKRAASEPSHEGKAQSADTAWWELVRNQDVYPEMFGGGVSASAATNATAFTNLLSFFADGGNAYVRAGDYTISGAGLIFPDHFHLHCAGGSYDFNAATRLIFSGTGTKSHSISGATATTVANPSVGEAYLADSGTRGDNYKTLDLSVSFSAAIILGKGSGLHDVGVYPNLDGVAGYSEDDGDLSDDWSIGIWARNADHWSMSNVTCMGHWRNSAVLVSAHDIGDGKVPSNELGQAINCAFQGFRGVSIRSPQTVVGDNYGFAGTDFINCLMRSLNHQSAHLATSSTLSTPFASPSSALEISGDVMRGIQFLNCTFISRDDMVMMFDKCSEILFSGCYEEGKSIKVSGNWLANSLGTRMVSTSNAVGLIFTGNSKYAVDFSTGQAVDSSLSGERYTAAGVFTPSTHLDDDYTRRVFGSYIGHRFRKSTDRYIFADENDASQVIIDAAGRVQSNILFSGTVTIADDAAASIPTPKKGGQCVITCCGSTENGNFPDPLRSGTIFYDVGTATFTATKFSAGGTNFVAVNTDVTGTTGTDGNVTVGVILDNIRIENRQGGSQVFRYCFIG